jgi:hypothetical protein
MSAKLHKDFVEYRDIFHEKIKRNNPYEGYYESVYDNFMNGFEIASKGGILFFN